MKRFLVLSLVVLLTGCASSQPVNNQVAWPSSCGPEPEFFKKFTFDNHRRNVIYDMCERTYIGNNRTAHSARIQAIRAERQMMRSVRVK